MKVRTGIALVALAAGVIGWRALADGDTSRAEPSVAAWTGAPTDSSVDSGSHPLAAPGRPEPLTPSGGGDGGAPQRTVLDVSDAVHEGREVFVVDDDDRPVAGAELGVIGRDELGNLGDAANAWLSLGREEDELPLLLGTILRADAEGRAFLPRDDGRILLVAARASGLFGDRRLASWSTRIAEVTLRDTPTYEVRVVDAAGAPWPGARVWTAEGRLDDEGRPVVQRGSEILPVQEGAWQRVAGSDAGGIARVGPKRARQLGTAHRVVTVGGAFGESPVAEWRVHGREESDAVLELPPCTTVEVRVLEPGGAPVRGAEVTAVPARHGTVVWAPAHQTLRATAGADGVARLGPVEVDLALELEAMHPSGGTAVRAQGSGGGGRIEIVLRDADLAVVGRLVDEGGAPVTPAVALARELCWAVERVHADGERTLAAHDVRLAADGRFELRWESARAEHWQRIELLARADGPCAFARFAVTPPADRSTSDPVDVGVVALEPPAVLAAGVVVDAAGAPRSGVTLQATLAGARSPMTIVDTEGAWQFPRVRTGGDGAFEVVGPPTGFARIDLHAHHEERISALRVEGVAVGTTDVVLPLPAQVTVRGRLVAEPEVRAALRRGEPLALVAADGAVYRSGLQSDGEFVFRGRSRDLDEQGVEVGVYTLRVGPDGRPTWATIPGLVVARGTEGSLCELGDVSIEGLAPRSVLTVVDGAGRPLAASAADVLREGEDDELGSLPADDAGRIRYLDDGFGADLRVHAPLHRPEVLRGLRGDLEVALGDAATVALHWPGWREPPKDHVWVAVAAPSFLDGPIDDENGFAFFHGPLFARGEFDLTGTAHLPAGSEREARILLVLARELESKEHRLVRVVHESGPGTRITLQAEGSTESQTVSWSRSDVEEALERLHGAHR